MSQLLNDVRQLSDAEQFDFVIGLIDKMSVIQLSGLVKTVETRFDVKASSGLPIAGPSPQRMHSEPVVEEKTEFALFLKAVESAKKIQAIKEVRIITGLGLKEAKDLVDAAPKVVKDKMAKADAESAKKLLEAAGATVELR